MSNGLMPTYSYKPDWSTLSKVSLRSCSSRRARLWAGGTYFRAKDPGRHGNNIQVEIVEIAPPSAGNAEAYCVVTNFNNLSQEQVSGTDVDVFQFTGNFTDYWEIVGLDTTTPSAHFYSISGQIRIYDLLGKLTTAPTPALTKSFKLGALLYEAGKIALKVPKTAGPFVATDAIVVQQRFRIYPLVPITVVVSDDTGDAGGGASTSYTGWDIADLRQQINASDAWIEMIERSDVPTDPLTGKPDLTGVELNDYQDTEKDALVLTAFAALKLTGGDGLPAGPESEETGPCRSIIHVMKGEQQDGRLGDVNTVYEWAGASPTEGEWKPY